MRKRIAVAAAVVLACGALAQTPLFPNRPAEGRYYLDKVGVLDGEDASEIDAIGAKVMADKGLPIIVVVIQSRQLMKAGHLTVEQYARYLFDHWGIGSKAHSKGMLLLVCTQDREARIELGEGWNGTVNGEAESVMQNRIIPCFKAGDYSAGLVEGARGLRDIAYRNNTYGTSTYSGEYSGPYSPSDPERFYNVKPMPKWLPFLPFFALVAIGIVARILESLGWTGYRRISHLTGRPPYVDANYDDYLWRSPGSTLGSWGGFGGSSWGGGGGGGGGMFGGGSGGGGGSTGRW